MKKSQMKSGGKTRDSGSPRRIESITEYSKGTRVEAKVAGWTRYYSGEIVKKSRDGQTYEIKFDDGERKSGVRPSQIRREGATSGGSRSSTAEKTHHVDRNGTWGTVWKQRCEDGQNITQGKL